MASIQPGLSSKQKEVYRNVLLRDIDMVNGTAGGGNAGRTVILNIVMQLRKCCNHPYLFTGVEDRKLDPLGDHLIINCGKASLVGLLFSRRSLERSWRKGGGGEGIGCFAGACACASRPVRCSSSLGLLSCLFLVPARTRDAVPFQQAP